MFLRPVSVGTARDRGPKVPSEAHFRLNAISFWNFVWISYIHSSILRLRVVATSSVIRPWATRLLCPLFRNIPSVLGRLEALAIFFPAALVRMHFAYQLRLAG